MDCSIWRKLLGWLVISLPVVSAFECGSTLCNDIDNSDLTLDEKEYLKLNSLYPNNYYPDHYFIHDWNTAINVANAPENVAVIDYQFAKGVWFKMLTVMPSVNFNGTLFVPSDIEILSGYGYHVELPANYYASDYPDTDNGNCKRLYALANNNYFGDSKLKSVSVSSDTTLTTYFNLDVDVRVEHYSWDSYCCRWDSKDFCRRECHDCDYDYTETQSNRIRLSDSVDVKYYSEKPSVNFDRINHNTAIIDSNNSIKLLLKDAFFARYKYFFTVNYSYNPYYFLTLNAVDADYETAQNIYKNLDIFATNNFDNCKLKSWNYFYYNETECDIGYNPIDISISTDKLSYNLNETIKVNILPRDLLVKVSYANDTLFASGYTEFNAQKLANKITAEHDRQTASKLIYIKEHDNFAKAWHFTMFVLFNLFLYRILKHYFGGKHG